MGVRNTAIEGKAAMFCSTDGHAFGPVFDEVWECDDFLAWYEEQGEAAPHGNPDLRDLSGDDLDATILKWRAARATEPEGTSVA